MRTSKLKSLGVNADTGMPLEDVADHDIHQLTHKLAQSAVPHDHLERKADSAKPHSFDPRYLNESGWAILYGPNVSQQVKDALEPLIEHRQKQVGRDDLFKIFDGEEGYRPGDTAEKWLRRRRVKDEIEVVPLTGVPFYVMIVASPNDIPFEFQYGLDLFWAVGRLWFPTHQEFAHYAESVVHYDTMTAVPTSRQMAVFAPRNPGDEATGILIDVLAKPMVFGSGTETPFGSDQQFKMTPLLEEAATKDAMGRTLSGEIPNGPPALVFTGSHGMVFNPGDPRQKTRQGAIVCQEWQFGGSPEREQYFAAEDLPGQAKVHGMIYFNFSCYGGGWPRHDTYSLSDKPPEVGISQRMARLPQALMGLRDGGALAVLAHIDKAFTYSFEQAKHEVHASGFRTVIEQIMTGNRIGQATDGFNRRWASLSTTLVRSLASKRADPEDLHTQWIARDNARNYVLYGDPAVRLRVHHMPALNGGANGVESGGAH